MQATPGCRGLEGAALGEGGKGVVPWVACLFSEAGHARGLTTTARHRNCSTLGLDGQHGYEASMPALHQTSCPTKMSYHHRPGTTIVSHLVPSSPFLDGAALRCFQRGCLSS